MYFSSELSLVEIVLSNLVLFLPAFATSRLCHNAVPQLIRSLLNSKCFALGLDLKKAIAFGGKAQPAIDPE